ncbi:hypothetical protein Scep_017577 [Stephania cephalantha]|uniref:Nodulin-like domain-containing protein n=1 Tax=Stephania cephalantha TaxID=152367 RepID=A0AAP0NV31_9MAGN
MEYWRWSSSNKWTATVASIWIQCTSGSLYTFGIYSPLLKSTQHYDQSTLDMIAVFKDIGTNMGLLSGLLYTAVTPSSAPSSSSSIGKVVGGPWVVHLTGAIQCFTGYFLVWLSVTGALPHPPIPLMCFFMFLASHAQTFYNTANVVSAVQNFPNYSGTAVGIMKGFVGLSGAILIQLYRTIFVDDPSNFLLMLALLATLNPLLLMSFVRVCPSSVGDDKKYLNGFSIIAVVIAAYLMILIILESIITFGLFARIITFLVLFVALISPLYVSIKASSMESRVYHIKTSSVEGTALLDDQHSMDSMDLIVRNESLRYDAEEEGIKPKLRNLNLLQAMRTIDFWLLFVAMACGMGSGLATVNNISQIGESLGYSALETSTLVSLWSIWNFLGRFGAGFVSDYLLLSRGWSRPLIMAVTLAVMSIGHLLVASGLAGTLYAGPVLVGVCYGAQWSLMPTICSEIFSVLHMGTIFYTISIASPVGSYLLSVWLVGYVYDKEASIEGGNVCNGAHCFMLSFLIMACVSFLGSLVAFGLLLRTRKFYKQLVFQKSQLSAAAAE